MKKAQLSPIVGAIIFAVVILIMIGLFYNIAVGLSPVQSGFTCRLSAAAFAATKPVGGGESWLGNLNCKTQYLKIKKEGIYRYADGNYKKDIAYRNFQPKRADYFVKRLFARELSSCWKYIGEGKLDPFGEFDAQSKCIVCSQIDFEEYKNLDLSTFEDFLRENFVKDEEGHEMSYYSYLTQRASGDIKLKIVDTKPKSIVYYSKKQKLAWTITTKTDKSVQILDTAKVGQECEKLYG